MRNACLNLALVVGTVALLAPYTMPAIAADDDSAQTDAAAAQTDVAAVQTEAAAGPGEASPADPASEPAKPQKPKMVCRREPSTGSAIPKRICRSPHQVQADREDAKRNMNSLNDGQGGRTSGAGG
jgi:hypothetical protein